MRLDEDVEVEVEVNTNISPLPAHCRRNMSVSAIPSLFSSGSSSSKNWSARYGFWAATNEINDVIMIGGGCTLNNTVFSDAYISLDDGETWKRVAKQMSKKKAEGIVHAQGESMRGDGQPLGSSLHNPYI